MTFRARAKLFAELAKYEQRDQALAVIISVTLNIEMLRGNIGLIKYECTDYRNNNLVALTSLPVSNAHRMFSFSGRVKGQVIQQTQYFWTLQINKPVMRSMPAYRVAVTAIFFLTT